MFQVSTRALPIAALLAVFAVFSHWNVWSQGVFSMGWNSTLVWIGLGYLVLENNQSVSFKNDWVWLLPLVLIALSFSLYENPWLKLITFLLLPIVAGFFTAFGHLNDKFSQHWGATLIARLFFQISQSIRSTFLAADFLRRFIVAVFGQAQFSVGKRLLKAFLILIPLLILILVLLSSADEKFADMTTVWFDTLLGFLDWSFVSKIIWVFVFASVLLGVSSNLRSAVEIDENSGKAERRIDGLVAGVVISVVLIVYILFLSLQFEHLLVDALPVDFSVAENLVKSGFWQLFFLSGINVALFYWVYKNTGEFAQWILRVYLVACTLIMLSACWRMGLYVYYYGLSYEKFFASYTALYALFLFGYLGWAVYCVARKDIIRFTFFSSLWFFSLATLLPVERIIFHSNLVLSEQLNSRINRYHLTVLSTDVLNDVLGAIEAGRIHRNNWQPWVDQTSFSWCYKKWYETNLSTLLACRHIELKPLADNNESNSWYHRDTNSPR